MHPKNESDTAALISKIEEVMKVETATVQAPLAGQAIVAFRPDGMRLDSLKPFFDEYLIAPERIKGKCSHDTLESFLIHVNIFKEDERSAIYADQSSGTLQCVYDYHKPNDPKFCDHKSYYNAKKSKQWNIWTGNNGNVMGQGEFAAFIENNALDLIDPPGGDGYDYTLADNAILKIGQTLNTSIASASKVIELSRSFQVHERATATAAHNPSTGELTVEYVTEHKDASGGKLKVPGLFVIAIPVYEQGHNYRVVVRLRYRLKEGKMLWFYELYQPEKCIEDAFNEICNEASDSSGLAVYRGKPEMT